MPAPQPAASAESLAYPRRWPALFVLLLAAFMNLIDVTIVNVALPRLQESLGATSTEIEWVVAAYVLAFALGLLPFGRLGDTIGRKAMFQAGVVLFTLFSAACGLAPDMQTLILARVFQGLAGAMMMPQVLAIAQVMFPPRERGVAFSLFGLTAGLASVAGPLASGLLIGADILGLDWRPIFLVNIPFGVGAVVAAAILVPSTPANPALRHDIGGILLAALTVFLLVFPLIEGHSLGWPLWSFAMLGLAVVSAFAFERHEARRARSNLSQLLPVALLHNGSFLLGMTIVTVFFSGVAGFFIVLAVFLQTGFGLSPLESGLTTIPFPIGVLLASIVSGRFAGRWPRARIAGGVCTLILGMALLSVVVAAVGEAIDHWRFVLPLLVCGFGLGTAISSLFQSVLANVPPQDAGSGSGAMQSFQQLGGAIGIAITGQIFFSSIGLRLGAGAPANEAYVDGFGNALVFEIVVFAAVILLLFFLKPVQGSGAHGGTGRAHPAAEA